MACFLLRFSNIAYLVLSELLRLTPCIHIFILLSSFTIHKNLHFAYTYALLAVMIEAISLNFGQAHLTLALDASHAKLLQYFSSSIISQHVPNCDRFPAKCVAALRIPHTVIYTLQSAWRPNATAFLMNPWGTITDTVWMMHLLQTPHEHLPDVTVWPVFPSHAFRFLNLLNQKLVRQQSQIICTQLSHTQIVDLIWTPGYYQSIKHILYDDTTSTSPSDRFGNLPLAFASKACSIFGSFKKSAFKYS